MPRRQISQERKAAYYGGMLLTIVGALTFCSVFVTGMMKFGDFSHFESDTKSFAFRAILGMAMIVIGGILRTIGIRGVAGSGVILDPEGAREDVEPWSRMAGGMLKDALDETGIDTGSSSGSVQHAGGFEARLRELHALYQDGILTEEEYRREKAELLDRN